MEKCNAFILVLWILNPLLTYAEVYFLYKPIPKIQPIQENFQKMMTSTPENFMDYYKTFLVKNSVELFTFTVGVWFGRKTILQHSKKPDI